MEQFYMMFLVFSNDQIRISKEDFVQIFCKLQINSFDLTDAQGNEIGVALYKKSARFDHSCCPNAIVTFIGKEIKVIASEDISDSSKVRISYLNLLRPTSIRQKELQKRYFFICDCLRCSNKEEDFRVRVPSCCGKTLRRKSPEDSDLFLSETDLPLSKLSLSSSEQLFCDQCRNVYNMAMFEELEESCYAISSYKDAVGFYKLCALLSKEGLHNKYYRLIYEHEENLSLFWICWTIVMGYKISAESFTATDSNYKELDLIVEAGLRINRCLTTSPSYQKLQGPLHRSISLAFLVILSIPLVGMQDCILPGRGCEVVLPRMERFMEAFATVARSALPVCEKFAPHFPEVAEQVFILKRLAMDMNINI
ncbi:unnamed protein product [Hymenolepis diminuta]|uniref:SET domain-containing protein n=1 Tax=Hymenolepis diminuta TaxID=6216 RepID=A0A564YQB6_HYMDI|nr:unnamed protein product [Hymenolepis diminuta]